ncbi:MAG: AraC family transcriptional regulator [Lachnospiraceae bacterium]|nr:AraC family transcriptional regulator [Lachnospiraceae bacterium]
MYTKIDTNIFFRLPTNMIPTMIYANDVTPPPPFTHFKRVPEEFIIYLITDGKMYIDEGGIEYALEPMDMLILDPTRMHIGFKESPVHYYYVHFKLDNIEEENIEMEHLKYDLMDFRKHIVDFNAELVKLPHEQKRDKDIYKDHILIPKYVSFDKNTYRTVLSYITDMQKNLHTDKEYYNQMTGLKLMEFFIWLNRTFTDSFIFNTLSNADKIVINVIDYLTNNYAEKITSTQISKEFHINYDYLNRNFKKVTGKTIFELLTEIRIAKSKELLLKRTYTSGEIAQKTGFCNEYYFSRIFKKLTGTTAKGYVKEYYFGDS